jgi:curved DNA-binding protein CbpA
MGLPMSEKKAVTREIKKEYRKAVRKERQNGHA